MCIKLIAQGINCRGMMKISVIVPAFNEEKLLAGVLGNLRSSMRSFERPGWESELVVCDNNSTDRTAEIARSCGAMVVFEPVNQIARARNRGASIASGEWLIFVDADSWPCPDLFARIADAIESGRLVGGGSVIQFDRQVWWTEFLLACWNRLSRFKGWAAGSLVFCDASAFRAVGGFNQELFVSEEIDLSKRLLAWGKSSGRGMRIIPDFPMKTSARKTELYTLGEHFRFFLANILNFGRTVRRREECPIWYDGRR